MNHTNGIDSMTTGATRIARELGELAELEARLLAADAREARRKIVPGVIVMASAITASAASLPLLLAAAALALAELTAWSLPTCLTLVGLVTVAAAAAAGWLGWGRIVAGVSTFKRSQQEFMATVQCVRRLLSVSSDRAP
jgi:hypothetical protein